MKELSQFKNRQRAMEKLQEKLADLQKEQKAKQVNAAWREHTCIVRGNPVRVCEGREAYIEIKRIRYRNISYSWKEFLLYKSGRIGYSISVRRKVSQLDAGKGVDNGKYTI